jgi:hypothetical protein
MKTVVGFTMALATLVLGTAADAGVQDQRCYQRASWISVRAGTPCGFGTLSLMGGYSKKIIEPPHEGTAVLRADGRVYYSPKPGFTGRDRMRVGDCTLPGSLHCFIGVTFIIFVE